MLNQLMSFRTGLAGVAVGTLALFSVSDALASCRGPEGRADAVLIEMRTAGGGPGHGSGVIWAGGRHVVTNHHVGAAGTVSSVTLPDGRKVAARLVASDAREDLAVLELALPAPSKGLRFADATPGQRVVALGNPSGRGFHRSEGSVTGLGRQVLSGGALLNGLLETTTPLVPGNSGGPLYDCDGAFLGVNAAAKLTARGSEAGYTIPANRVAAVVAGLLRQGRGGGTVMAQAAPPSAAPPSLGVLVQPAGEGLAVVGVTPGAIGERAGLQVGDVIRAVGAQTVAVPQAVTAALSSAIRSGRTTLQVVRGGQVLSLTIRLS